MRETKLLSKLYSKNNTKFRLVNDKTRSINNRIIATKRDKEFFDGSRNNGYGGYVYDGRWSVVAKAFIEKYNLSNKSNILHINCEKGYLLYEIKKILPRIKITGYETSNYAINKSHKNVKHRLKLIDNYLKIPKFRNKKYDLVIAIGVVYAFNLKNSLDMLKLINFISKKSYITLASYSSTEDYWLFKNWTLLGTLLLTKKEWKILLTKSKYKGNYEFTNSETLNLKRK